MRKTIAICVFAVLLVLAGATDASAQARFEVNVNWPVLFGISSSNSLFGGNVDLSSYHFILPDLRIYYQFGGDGLVRGGIGVRAYTVIVESFIWPEAFVELNLTPIELEASLGGFLFGIFGLYSNLTTASIMFPDFNVGWQILPWLRLGGGVLLGMPIGSDWNQNFVYMGYIGARFIFLPK